MGKGRNCSAKTHLTPEIIAKISEAQNPVAQYLAKYSTPPYMWDELSAAALIDPFMITRAEQRYVDIDVDHGPSYGETLFWAPEAQVPPYEKSATVQFDVDVPKFSELFVNLMTHQYVPSGPKP